jgi:hypothetical protein
MALGGLGGLGGFINSDQGGNVLQALGMSLMSSPSNHMFKNMPTILTSLQDQSRLDQKDRRELELKSQEREALKTALIAGGLDEGEAETLSINPAAAKIRLEQVSKDRAAQQEQDFFRTFNAGYGDLSGAPRVDDTGDSWAPHRQEFGWAEPGQGEPDTPVEPTQPYAGAMQPNANPAQGYEAPVQVAHAQVEPYTNPPRDGRQSRLGASQPIANPAQGYEAPVQVAQAGPQPVSDAYTPPQFQITNPEAQRLMKNREQLVRYHMQAPSDRTRKIIENNISHIDKQLEQVKPTDTQRNLEWRAREAGLEPGTKAYRDFVLSGGSGPLVTVNTGSNSSKFVEESDKSAATRMNDYIAEGSRAGQTMADMQQLLDLGAIIGTGREAELKLALGPYAQMFGIEIENLGEAQAYNSIVDRLAPQMRPTGAGSSSDTDVRMYLNALPALRNMPEGNTLIANTMKGVAQNKMQAAEIAALAQSGEITWQEAEKQIRALPNPYENFKEFMRESQRDQKAAAKEGRTSTNVPWSIEE